VGWKRITYRVLVGHPAGKITLERPRHTWQDNIKIELREIGWECELNSVSR
jgi:hypothetical protein